MQMIMERRNSRQRSGKMNKENKMRGKDTQNRKKKTRKVTKIFPKTTRTCCIELSMDNLIGVKPQNENQEMAMDPKTLLKRGKYPAQDNRMKVMKTRLKNYYI